MRAQTSTRHHRHHLEQSVAGMDSHADAVMEPAPRTPLQTQSPTRMHSPASHQDMQMIDPTVPLATTNSEQIPMIFGMKALRNQKAQQSSNRLPENQPLTFLSCKGILEEDRMGTRFKLEGWLTHFDRTTIRTIDNSRYNTRSPSKSDQKPTITKRSVWDIIIADETAAITCTLWDEAVANLMQQLPKAPQTAR